jgi:hypothetical protein
MDASDMHRKYFLAVIIMTTLLIGPAGADSTGAPPSFTPDEQVIIDRNASLRDMSKANPWVARRLLDALQKIGPESKSHQAPPPTGNNPDLDRLERSSPEAALDLFQLLKQAGARR